MYVIDEDGCIGCGACASVCPTSAISKTEEDKYRINNDCIDCEACVTKCPVDVISPGD